jgi:dihydroorotase
MSDLPRSDLLVRNVRLLDPAAELDRPGGLLVLAGRIADVGSFAPPENIPVLDGEGAVLCPGLVDLRCRLGEPGFEYRETIASAAQAAAAGGITTLCPLPDSQPAIDDPALVYLLRARGMQTRSLSIVPYAALTRGCRGDDMAELFLLHEAGAVAFTDGARATADARLMRLALAYVKSFGGRIVQFPEERSLAAGGCATEGELATRLGLPAIPAAAESIQVARDIALATLTGGALHFSCVSAAASLDLIRDAKRAGVNITADTAPPYFDLNETAIGDYRTFAKLSPPLRADTDRQAVAAALADGTIDAVVSDHTPLDADDKRLPFAQAGAGGTGLATLLGVTLAQYHAGNISLNQAIALLTDKPARLMNLPAGTLARGAEADFVLLHPDRIWQVQAGKLPGKSQNTPFDGRALEGTVVATFKAGRKVFG